MIIIMFISIFHLSHSFVKLEKNYHILSCNLIELLFGNKDKFRGPTKRLETSINIRKLAPYHQSPQRRQVMELCGWAIERDIETTITR
jgi:hypothetical protein